MATGGRATRPVERRTLHFNLSHTVPDAQHTLHLGGRRYTLRSHTNATRAHYRMRQGLLGYVPDNRLTHYLEEVEFPADAVQSFYVTYPSKKPDGPPHLSLMSIHVPQEALDRLILTVDRPGVLYASKARRLGLGLNTAGPGPAKPKDLADYHDMSDAAKHIVFHHPELISLGTDIPSKILAHIEHTRSFDDLVTSLGEQGQAQRPGSDDEGWANGEYLKDLDGNSIPVKDKDGKAIPGRYRWKYVYTRKTRDAMRPVVQQALLRVRDDKDMEGISFATEYGKHNVRNSVPARAGLVSVHEAAQLENSPYKYKLDDPDWKSGRQVVIKEFDDRKVTIAVNNNYFRYLGIYARYLRYDTRGSLIPVMLKDLKGEYESRKLDGDYINFLGKVDDRPRIMGIPIKAQEEAEFEIEIPGAANVVEILCGGLGTGIPKSEHEHGHVPGAVLTGVLNLGIPGFFLLFGLTSNFIESEGKALIVKLATWIVDTFAGIIVRQSLHGAGYSQDGMATGWAMDILNSLIKESPSFFAELIAFAAAVSAEEALEESVPVVGLVLEALGVVATLVEITETCCDIALSPPVIPARITSTLDIAVTIKPDPNNFQFPASATKYKLVAHLTETMKWDSGWVDFDIKKFDPQNKIFPTYKFEAIPAGGEVEVTVQFVSETGWVAAYGSTNKVANIVKKGGDALELEINITENPVPLTGSTIYKHQRMLGLRPDLSHSWIETKDGKGPAETKADLGGNGSVTLEDLTNAQITFNMHKDKNGTNVAVIGYSWQGKSPTLSVCGAGNGASTPLYTMQNIELGTANPDSLLKVLNCGVSAPLLVAYDLIAPATGGHFVVAPAPDGSKEQHYHVRKLDLSAAGDIDLAKLPSWGRFASPKIGSIAAHGDEFLLALSPDLEMVEILRLPKQPYAQDGAAEYATQIGKDGSYVGRLKGSRAMALTRDGNTFLVLEETNNRIQAFNTNGQVVKYFEGSSEIPLRQCDEDNAPNKQITYLDMSLEYGGHLYVLSYEAAGEKPDYYRLDIYDPKGKKLARTRGVSAARLVVDQWRVVYTLNFKLLIGRNQRPEPSVSLWATSG